MTWLKIAIDDWATSDSSSAILAHAFSLSAGQNVSIDKEKEASAHSALGLEQSLQFLRSIR